MRHLRLILFLLSLLGTIIGGAFWILSQFFNEPTHAVIAQTLHMSDVTIVYEIIYSVSAVAVCILGLIAAIVIAEKWGIYLTITRGERPSTSELSKREKTLAGGPEPIYSQEQKNYRKKVRDGLLKIRQELRNTTERRAIQFESWNAFTQPDRRPEGINNPKQFRAIENFSIVLNRRNDHLTDTAIDDECIVEYVKIRQTGFLEADSPEEDKPRLIVIPSHFYLESKVRKIEVRFPGHKTREHEVRFYYITIRNVGRKTADDVIVNCGGDDMRIIPFTTKSSFGINVESFASHGMSVEELDKLGAEGFITVLLRDHNKVKDSIEYIHPGPKGETFVLFFTVEGIADEFYVPAHTKIWYNAYGGHYNSIPGTKEKRSTILSICVGARDMEEKNVQFEVTLRNWNDFDAKLISTAADS